MVNSFSTVQKMKFTRLAGIDGVIENVSWASRILKSHFQVLGLTLESQVLGFGFDFVLIGQ